MSNIQVCADAYKTLPNETPPADLVLLDPVYGQPSVNNAIHHGLKFRKAGGALICFMYPEDTFKLEYDPDQIVHWVKPVSTKNTSKRYSRFIEAIAVWHGTYFNQNLHWSCRTGVFTDTLTKKHKHPWRKPYSLIEKLILLHTPPQGTVIDLFAGSCVTHDVCVANDMSSYCVEQDRAWLSF